MTAEKTLQWLRERIPEARLIFKSLRYQPKGCIRMAIGAATRAVAWPEKNLIVWGSRYLLKATGEQLIKTLKHELLHLALPLGVVHGKLFKNYAQKLGIERYCPISLRKSPSYKTLRTLSTKKEAEKVMGVWIYRHPHLEAHRFAIIGKRGEWRLIWRAY